MGEIQEQKYFQKADLKSFYLTAQRLSQRRYKEQLDRGEDVNLEDIEKEIKERDIRDMTRTIAPLKLLLMQ